MAGAGKKLMRVRILTSEQCLKLGHRGITTTEEFLSANMLDLMTALSLSYWQLLPLLQAMSHTIAPHPTNVLEMYRESCSCPEGVRKGLIPTSLCGLDKALHGGLLPGTMTEVVGPPGCGKTQLCLTVTMTTALPPACGGRGLGVVFIDTEATFSATRLMEMARSRHPSLLSLSELAGRVRVHRALTAGELERVLSSLEEELLEMGAGQGAGLVVVDSVAGPVRREFGAGKWREMAERAATLSGFATRLKCLAEVFNIAVVVTNQVTTTAAVSRDVEGESDWSVSGGGHVTAALGNTWAHCVNTRLLLTFDPSSSQRTLTVDKSPVSANERFIIRINEKGVVLDSSATPTTEP